MKITLFTLTTLTITLTPHNITPEPNCNYLATYFNSAAIELKANTNPTPKPNCHPWHLHWTLTVAKPA